MLYVKRNSKGLEWIIIYFSFVFLMPTSHATLFVVQATECPRKFRLYKKLLILQIHLQRFSLKYKEY
jgi:hypothetical protein